MAVTGRDRLYLRRACELAARGIGNVSPNPPVGAVIVHESGRTLGEGFHRQRGHAHAEVEAIRSALAAGCGPAEFAKATIYVSLEPCNHFGRTPPCSEALVAAGFARAVIGTPDPNPRTAFGGVQRLKDAGFCVDVVHDAQSEKLIERFAASMRTGRPYVTLKIASSLDGYVAPHRGSYWLTGDAARRFVRELRADHDIVLVGAGTARIDNPDLTPRPPRSLRRPLLRGVVCGRTPLSLDLQIFAPKDHVRSMLFVPASARAVFADCSAHAEVISVADEDGAILPGDLLQALHDRDIGSVLCEGGPTLAQSWLRAGVVDRLEWLVAPQILAAPGALPSLSGDLGPLHVAFDHIERLGDDIRMSVSMGVKGQRDAMVGATEAELEELPKSG